MSENRIEDIACAHFRRVVEYKSERLIRVVNKALFQKRRNKSEVVLSTLLTLFNLRDIWIWISYSMRLCRSDLVYYSLNVVVILLV
jgi:hypothetical protein